MMMRVGDIKFFWREISAIFKCQKPTLMVNLRLHVVSEKTLDSQGKRKKTQQILCVPLDPYIS